MTSHQTFFGVNLAAWVRGTIKKVEKHRDGISWRRAWVDTYRKIGGEKTSGEKVCPMKAAEILYDLGRLKDGGLPFRDCEISDLWNRSRNGTYAILATRLLRERPDMSKASLWEEIQCAVRRETGDEPACKDPDAARLAYQLWHLGLIVEGPA